MSRGGRERRSGCELWAVAIAGGSSPTEGCGRADEGSDAEAVFNLLGPAIRGMRVYDLFAGTGAMALSASRGRLRRARRTAHPHREGDPRKHRDARAADLCDDYGGCLSPVRHPPDAGEQPWLVFCCPPYDFFVERRDATLQLVRAF